MNGKVLSEKAPVSVDEPTDRSGTGYRWKTVLFNCSCHTFPEVAIQLMKAIGCTYERGMQFANVVHYTGTAIVYSGPKERCEAVAGVLHDIGLRVSVEN